MSHEEKHMLSRLARAFAVPLLFAAISLSLPALASKKTEEELIAQLASTDEGKVTSALQGLEKEYPDSPTARAKVIAMLKDPREKVQRKAARVLGALTAKVDAKVLADITPLLKSTNKDAVVDGLKALRGLEAASTVPQILPLLASPDENIKRDACRTLAEIGSPAVIGKSEPLLADPNKKVQSSRPAASGRSTECSAQSASGRRKARSAARTSSPRAARPGGWSSGRWRSARSAGPAPSARPAPWRPCPTRLPPARPPACNGGRRRRKRRARAAIPDRRPAYRLAVRKCRCALRPADCRRVAVQRSRRFLHRCARKPSAWARGGTAPSRCESSPGTAARYSWRWDRRPSLRSRRENAPGHRARRECARDSGPHGRRSPAGCACRRSPAMQTRPAPSRTASQSAR